MRQWYCAVAGQQYGPVSEELLHDWIQQGRLGPADHLWTVGMSDWAVAASVPGFFLAGQTPLVPPPNSLVVMPPPDGTGGQTPNGRITAQARELLKGNWGLSIGVCVVGGIIASGGGIPYVGPIISIVLAGPIDLGMNVFFLTLVRRGRCEFELLFRGFRNFGGALGAYVLMTSLIFAWSLLLLVPGIIAALAYSQTFYLMAQDTTLGPLEAIRASKRLMAGRKWKLFCLGWRFFGWGLLCLLTCGIGFLWLQPYMTASFARFHDDLHESPAAAGEGANSVSFAQPGRQESNAP